LPGYFDFCGSLYDASRAKGWMLMAARPCCIQVVISSLLRVAVSRATPRLVQIHEHGELLHHLRFCGDDLAILSHLIAAEATGNRQEVGGEAQREGESVSLGAALAFECGLARRFNQIFEDRRQSAPPLLEYRLVVNDHVGCVTNRYSVQRPAHSKRSDETPGEIREILYRRFFLQSIEWLEQPKIIWRSPLDPD
jgi:hypothetical protein